MGEGVRGFGSSGVRGFGGSGVREFEFKYPARDKKHSLIRTSLDNFF
jgi:hypothetical protein